MRGISRTSEYALCLSFGDWAVAGVHTLLPLGRVRLPANLRLRLKRVRFEIPQKSKRLYNDLDVSLAVV
jgi:hypothetical protein